MLSVLDASANEGANLIFTVNLMPSSNAEVTVDYTTADGEAKVGTDYQTTSGSLTFAAGDSSQQITVMLIDDRVAEANETLNIILSNPSANAASLAPLPPARSMITKPLQC